MGLARFVKRAIRCPRRVGAPAPTLRRTARFMIEVTGVGKGDVIVDAGTGTGVIALEAARRGCEVIAVDLDEELLRVARARAREEGLDDRIEFVRADVRELPELVDRVDAVISTVPIKTLPDPERVFEAYAEVIRPDGKITQLTHWPRHFRRVISRAPVRVERRYLRWVHLIPGFIFVCRRE